MNKLPQTHRLAATIVLATLAALTASQAATALNGQLSIRALTPQEKKDYALPTAQGASGLNTVGIGQPAYLDALVNKAIAPSNIVSVTWGISQAPVGSAATLAPSPLGPNVPPYKMADRASLQVAGRTMLIPDIVGQYTVTADIVSVDSGTTNLTQQINAGTYMGQNTCALCHSGGQGAPNIMEPWSHTGHATFLTRSIDGHESDHYGKNCISCHTVGFDANPNAVNGGFDDVATLLGWTFPTNLVEGNWASMPADLKNLANIQCENCHGPGSLHAFSLGRTNLISRAYSAGDCAQCHDSLNNHPKNAEWNNSRHAIATRSPSGPTRAACIRCHTAPGFTAHMSGTTPITTSYEAITCQACHDPHDATNPYQLREGPTVTLDEGTTVTTAGLGALCMNCHQSRTGSITNSLANYPIGLPTWAGGSSWGPHDNPAADMLMGVNGETYGKHIPSAAHGLTVTNTCVGCHMQTLASTDPGFTKAGGHTMKLSYDVVQGGVTNTVHLVNACVKCHGEIESFDMPKSDYNGDGVIEGVQTEVQHLLDKLSTLTPGPAYRADGNYVADGLVKTRMNTKTNWQVKFLKADWNWRFVNNDLSKGVHNAPYAVGLLKASIGDLTGDTSEDGLPDAWQIQYFGSVNAPNAAPNATPAGDGVPNWLKFSLGLDPTVPGIALPTGVLWTNGKDLVNPPIDPGDTNSVQIFRAAEVAFNTAVGTTYQIQAISALSGVWENLGAPIVGTGAPISYVTPTRQGTQMFYRVVRTP